jgi:hypothetical protein
LEGNIWDKQGPTIDGGDFLSGHNGHKHFSMALNRGEMKNMATKFLSDTHYVSQIL